MGLSLGISGFQVVRRPKFNLDATGRGVYPTEPPTLNGIYYGGFDRMPWFDVNEDFYNHTLPPRIAELREIVENDRYDASGIALSRDLGAAVELLNYSNRLRAANELTALRSKNLAAVKGTVDFHESRANWIGYDVVIVREFSLLREGVFAFPSGFPGWEQKLNAKGLLSDLEDCRQLIPMYEELAQQELVDCLSTDPYETDIIEIGRVSL